MAERAQLLNSLAMTMADYRAGELPSPKPDHVYRWVRQFTDDVQVPLLRELDYVLKKTYFTRKFVQEFLDNLVRNNKLTGDNPFVFWKGAELLRIQQNGNSQSEMLELFAESLRKHCGLALTACAGAGGQYIYLDDVLFSGSRIGNDLSAWIRDDAPQEAEVHIIVIATHELGWWQCHERLKTEAQNAGKKIEFKFWRVISFENRKRYRDSSEVLWPASLPEDAQLKTYMAEESRFPFELRRPGGKLKSNVFSSENGRQLLERELLLAGVRIRAHSQNPSRSVRPLGFSAFGLGFGSMIVTFRNSVSGIRSSLARPTARRKFRMISSSEACRVSQVRTYDRSKSVVFLKTNEEFGGLSNMAGGFPLVVNGIHIFTSEALYQACRFPHMPEIQRLIISQASPMTAKMKSKPYRGDSRPDWNQVRVKIMRWCLRVKLAQNWTKFSELLLATGDRPIVEQSRKDDFWGAKPVDVQTLVGVNVLGRLLMELREEIRKINCVSPILVEPLSIPDFLLSGEPIRPIIENNEREYKKSTQIAMWTFEPRAKAAPPPPLGGGHKPESELERPLNILRVFDDQFGNIKWTDTDRVRWLITVDIPARVAADAAYQNAIQNSDPQMARNEHDKALTRVMTVLLKDDTELFKQFSDNDSFRGWLADMIFGITYNRPVSDGGTGVR